MYLIHFSNATTTTDNNDDDNDNDDDDDNNRIKTLAVNFYQKTYDIALPWKMQLSSSYLSPKPVNVKIHFSYFKTANLFLQFHLWLNYAGQCHR